MQIDLCNKLVNNSLTRDDLINRVEIQKTNEDDFDTICETLSTAFGLNSVEEAVFQLRNSKVLLNESIKLVDKKTKEIYGLLIFTEYPLKIGSPISIIEPTLCEYLDRFKQVNGHSFIIDERLRGCGLDKKMLFFNIEYLSNNYDMIWIGVERNLPTHNYWVRLGFVKIFEMEEATFYMVPFCKKITK